jgi:diguanylate cyclase (GGDEF)-like protein/PAS domain S-box-containing protein
MRDEQSDAAVPFRLQHGEHGLAIRLMEHLVVPTFVLGADGRILIWNRACERLTGVSAQEIVGTTDHWKAFFDEPRPCLADLVLAKRYNEIVSVYGEGNYALSDFGVSAESWCVMPKAGHRLYLAIDTGPIFDAAGNLVAVVETARDVTIQKQAQIELEMLATRDGLTGLANRRTLDLRLDEEAKRAARDRLPLSLLLIDVDCFKAYNDTYGHLEGDECLRAVASSIASVLGRSSDFAARYGGEEFAVILPNTPLSGAMVVAEKIRGAVENRAILHANSTASDRVTVSIGGAAGRVANLCAERLIACADAGLYRAKRQGRNQSFLQRLVA